MILFTPNGATSMSSGKLMSANHTLLESMALEDIANGHGVCFIDPHGQSAGF
jgi:hypothetical protein